MTVIDAHQHFWSLDLAGHHWPGPDLPLLYRDVLPEEFRGIFDPRVAGTVLVQSQANDGDTDWLLDIADTEPMVLGVVGWVDLGAADAPGRIAALAGRRKMRGLRAMLECIPDVDWLMDAAFTPALQAMVAHDLSLDMLVGPQHLPMLARFVDRWPDLRVVIDHGAKPFTLPGRWDAWQTDIAVLAQHGVHCKLSALRVPGQPDAALRSTVLHLVEQFPGRLMWASDWPVLSLVGEEQGGWLDSAIRLSGLSGVALDHLLAGCARQFYSLG